MVIQSKGVIETVKKINIIIDANAILEVIMNEEHRDDVIRLTQNSVLQAPECIDFEIGNALSAMMKRHLIDVNEAIDAYHEFAKIPIDRMRVDIADAVRISGEHNIYAYDAFYLVLAQKHQIPLLTYDKRMKAVAAEMEVVCLQ